MVPIIRIQTCNNSPIKDSGKFVLYWMIAFRRTGWNFSLQRAIEWARTLHKPLVILEPLRVGYEWACDRFHRFIIEGMVDNAVRLKDKPVLYYPYLESIPDGDKGLLTSLANHSCVVVTDNFPAFFLPRMVASAASKLSVRLEKVDSNGLLPLKATDQIFSTAFSFRRFLQKSLRQHLVEIPEADPLAEFDLPRLNTLPREITERWPQALVNLLAEEKKSLSSFLINHAIGPVELRGGTSAAEAALKRFLSQGLSRYAEYRNQPEEEITSGLSPYLHFGHISAHQIFIEIMIKESWSLARLPDSATGRRSGWWGVSESAEAFLDQLITWRELGYNMCWHRKDYDRYESIPSWASKTLANHSRDLRKYVYTLEEFEAARTHDDLWNAAQMQLVREGIIHNYLRMLWGKKILEWSRNPQRAMEIMIELNNKYGLDGRDPNSYSGIFWVLGRYDRPWGPERPIFGTIRYMSSENTARKVHVKKYTQKYTPS